MTAPGMPPPDMTPPAIIRTAAELGLGQGVAADLYQQNVDQATRERLAMEAATVAANQTTTSQPR